MCLVDPFGKPGRAGPAAGAGPTAVLLDRDGVLNERIVDDYVRRPEQLRLLPGAAEAVARLTRAGIPTFVVTNQRGVARGLMSAADVDAVHERLRREIAAAGSRLDGIYVCPHETGSCDCRKPLPGLAGRIRADHPGLDLAGAVMVGDSDSDVGFARAVGCRVVWVGPGEPAAPVDGRAPDLAAAVELLLPG
jgi:D-glycero-D-manno-heptose 1,7-bisphosphate phosphatase